ncbi:MAG: prepilin-type N-terminal cleavage/methylation domain-containing protein [Pseudomonadota bacterium]|nr:prepilin-type N-terminal cleavage/methylation domain-containing protein [Pseudomonadota bacterium]
MKRSSEGFTLIEVLVAMTIMAVMAMMAWQGIDGIVRARDSNQGHLEQTLRVDSVIAQWDQDLASIQESAAVPALLCDGSTVRLTRRAEGGLQVVAWALRPDAAGFTWWRWASPAVATVGELQDNWLRTQQFQGGETGQLRTLAGLSGWQVYFFQGNAWSNCQSTGDVAAPSPLAVLPNPAAVGPGAALPTAGPPASAPTPTLPSRQALPAGVRIVLSFAPGSGENGSLTRDTLLGP